MQPKKKGAGVGEKEGGRGSPSVAAGAEGRSRGGVEQSKWGSIRVEGLEVQARVNKDKWAGPSMFGLNGLGRNVEYVSGLQIFFSRA